MVNPWIRWIGTAPWRVVDDTMRLLERKGHVSFTADKRDTVVGEICSALDGEFLLRDSRFRRVCQVFDGYEETQLPGGDLRMIALEACGIIDNGGGELELSRHFARYQREAPPPEVASSIELAAFVPRMLEAYHAPID